jgi:glycerate 2-kinase
MIEWYDEPPPVSDESCGYSEHGISLCRIAREACETGVRAAQPESVLKRELTIADNQLQLGNTIIDLDDFTRVAILAVGNAAGTIGSTLTTILDDIVTEGIVITDNPREVPELTVHVGTHPLPSHENMTATADLLDSAAEYGAETLVIVGISGGGSALLTAPASEISLEELRETTEALLRSGVPINALNTVRKHLSAVKGGQLAECLAPARTVGLLFSDVASDDPAVIASGPLTPDETTYQDAIDVLARYEVSVSENVRSYLEAGASGTYTETPSSDDQSFRYISQQVIASNHTALTAAAETCAEAGYEPLILSSSIRGEAREVGTVLASIAEECRDHSHPLAPPAAILSGGETTVHVQGDGRGGPNQELAVSAGLELPENAVLASVDTDGIDGATDAAGAIVSASSLSNRKKAVDALQKNDVYGLLKSINALVGGGATGTNVNDLRVLLISDS